MRLSVGRRPSRKRSGRLGPPPRYPKDQDSYADPENWKYPVHTPHHAMAARRYFNKPWNRRVYNPEEQLYIDFKINEALRRFGIEPASISGTLTKVAARGLSEEKPHLKTASLDECLEYLLGQQRLRRAKAIGDEELVFQREQGRFKTRIRDYTVEIDFERRTISHDCADWNRRKTIKKLCKHLGKILLTIPEDEAITLVKDFIANTSSWILG